MTYFGQYGKMIQALIPLVSLVYSFPATKNISSLAKIGIVIVSRFTSMEIKFISVMIFDALSP